MTPDSAEAALAAIVRLDILPRLIGAAPDSAAGALATELIASGRDKNLPPLLRSLVFMPLLHGDRMIDRERAIALFAGLRRETQDPVFEEIHAFALRRRDESGR
jgi:uncharacterized protein (DUF924 family)